MREIKFRGKSLANGEWIFGSLYNDGGEDYILPNLPASATVYELYQVDLNTIGQYTGLKDINGKEIYEGDVVRSSFGNMHYVVYDNTHACFSAVRIKDGTKSMCSISEYWILHFNKNIVGNIYDNKELLNEKSC